MLCYQRFFDFAADLDLPCAWCTTGKCAFAMKKRDFVFLEQIQNAVVVLLDDFILALEHLRNVHAQASYFDAVIRKCMRRVIVVLRRLQQRLGRNAADVGTRATRRRFAVDGLPIVDAGHLHAQLCRTNRGNVTARAGADDYYVELIDHL